MKFQWKLFKLENFVELFCCSSESCSSKIYWVEENTKFQINDNLLLNFWYDISDLPPLLVFLNVNSLHLILYAETELFFNSNLNQIPDCLRCCFYFCNFFYIFMFISLIIRFSFKYKNHPIYVYSIHVMLIYPRLFVLFSEFRGYIWLTVI